MTNLLSLSLAINVYFFGFYLYGMQGLAYAIYGNLWDIRISQEIISLLTLTNILTWINITTILCLGWVINSIIGYFND